MSSQTTIAIIGAGSRGNCYAKYAKSHPDLMKIVAIAEPCEAKRNMMAQEYDVPQENLFTCWKELAAKDKIADAVIIATQDDMHEEPAIAFAKKKYAMLLEKPIAPNVESCKRIVEEVQKQGIVFGVCHVLRYTKYTQTLKKMLDDGMIGDLVSIQQLEPVGYQHYAHSFVRGNWRNEKESSFMLLAKSCHDLDWIKYIVGAKCNKVASFGDLKHFKKENMPKGAARRCLDCKAEDNCPYSAKKIYLKQAKEGDFGWPIDVVTTERDFKGVERALQNGPYGKCVYQCDNDVVDHQVVIMEFENGCSVNFTMTAFTEMTDRRVRLFGSRGEIYGDGNKINHYDFMTNEWKSIDVSKSDGGINSGHGGGDYEIMKSFVKAVAKNDQSLLLTGAQESLESHLSVFAAENARKEGIVLNI